MEILESLITSLNPREFGELQAYTQFLRRSEREVKLLRILREHPAGRPRETAEKLYKPVNMNAYHSVRNRLLVKTVNFVAMQRVQAEGASPDALVASVLVARWLIDRNLPDAALHFLKKAEATASSLGRYALLENIYLIYIDYAHLLQINAVEVSQRWETNARAYTTFRKLKMAAAIIHHRFEAVRAEGFPPEPETIIDPVLASIEITNEEANHPNFQLTLATIIRRAYASVKRYEQVERYVSRVYRRLEQHEAFTAAHANERAQFRYMHAHALYRVRAFERCLEEVESLKTLIAEHTGMAHPLWAKAVMLEAAVYAYTGKNEQSIALLAEALALAPLRLDQRDAINMQLNLAVYYFNATDYRAANRTLRQITLNDKRIDALMGKEWRFKRGMIALIVQYELGNVELALSLIHRLQKEFGEYLKHPAYDRAGAFLNFIARLIHTPEAVNADSFKEEIKATSMMLTADRDDLQGMVFFCWLRSKMFRKPYYEVLVERLNHTGDSVA
jgi:tetratricopeptide (TPR) repeat protein